MKKRKIIYIFCVILMIFLFLLKGNYSIEINKINIKNAKLPESFNGYKIVQISDLHNAEFGKNNEYLLEKIKNTKPDIIVITGDMIDSRHSDIEKGISFAVEALKIAPVYYIPGNHESRIEEYPQIQKKLTNAGVTVLINRSISILKNNESIILSGIIDPAFYTINHADEPINEMINNLNIDKSEFNILLSHRPETFDIYADKEFDLVFSGHAHGGQIRIPFIGGVVAPGQGFFPKYDSGIYSQSSTSMIVSRGLGNSIFPFRINNQPEIIVAELNKN